MNGAHWHLVVNHLPIVFPIVGSIVLITGLISRSEAVKRTSYLIFLLGALASIVSMSTGEGAEHIIKRTTENARHYIHIHEEKAEVLALLSYVLGGLSILGLWGSFKQKSFANSISIIALLISIIVLYFGKETGTTGGEITHLEIRNGFIVPEKNSPKIGQNETDSIH